MVFADTKVSRNWFHKKTQKWLFLKTLWLKHILGQVQDQWWILKWWVMSCKLWHMQDIWMDQTHFPISLFPTWILEPPEGSRGRFQEEPPKNSLPPSGEMFRFVWCGFREEICGCGLMAWKTRITRTRKYFHGYVERNMSIYPIKRWWFFRCLKIILPQVQMIQIW